MFIHKITFRQYQFQDYINLFPNTPIWDRPKFKEAADNNWNVAIKGFQDTNCIENIVEKGEIAQNEQFHLFQLCFPTVFFFIALKWVYMEERVNSMHSGKCTCTSKIIQHIMCSLIMIYNSK